MSETSSNVDAKTSKNTDEGGSWRLVSALAAATLAAVLVDAGYDFLALEGRAPSVAQRDLFRLCVHYLASALAVAMPVLAIGTLIRVVLRSSSGRVWPLDKGAVRELEKRIGLRDDYDDYGGYSVEVNPASLTITFVRRGKDLDVGSFELDSSTFNVGAQSRSGNSVIDQYFTYKAFDSQVAAKAHRGLAWLRPAERFLRRGGRALAGIQCNAERVVFSYRRWQGGGLSPRQTDIEQWLQEMLAFCNALYSAVTFPTLLPREAALARFDAAAGDNPRAGEEAQGVEPSQAAATTATLLIEQPGAAPHGPVTLIEVVRLLHERRISPLTRVRRTEEMHWTPLALTPALSDLFVADAEPAEDSKLPPLGAESTRSFFAKPARFAAKFPPLILIAAVVSLVCGRCALEVQSAQTDIDRTAHWRATTGTSLGANIGERRIHLDERWVTEYQVTVRYSYAVQGKPYTSNLFNVLHRRSEQPHLAYREAWVADQTAEAYARGTEVAVYYDPQDPGTAVLDRDISVGIFFALELMLLLVTMVLSFLIIANQLSNRKPRPPPDIALA